MARYHSAVFGALFAWDDALQAQSFPAHPVTARVPSVSLGDLDPEAGQEAVIVVADAPDDDIEWAVMSKPGRDERIRLRCVIRSHVPGTATARDALERLEDLADVVQETLFDPDANAPHVTLGFDGEQALGRVSSVLPAAEPTEAGWFGSCVITVDLFARI